MEHREKLISVEEAARPTNPSSVTVWRWMRWGVKSRAGGTIRLRHVRYGARLFTTEPDVVAFAEALALADAEHFQPAEISRPEGRPPQRSGSRQEQEIAAVRKRLKQAGIIKD